MRIAVLANLKKNAPTWEGMTPDQWDDLDSPKTTDALVKALEYNGHEAAFFEASIHAPHNLIEKLQAYKPDLAFNIAESHFGNGRESQIPALLEMLRIPYTASNVLTLALALDKPMTKRLLMYHGLPTPEFQVFERPDEPIHDELMNGGDLRWPLFIKPSREGTGMGVSGASIIRTVAELRERVAEHIRRYDQPILCERYIRGREVTLGVIGNIKPNGTSRSSERATFNGLPEELTFFPPLEVNTSAYPESEADLYTNRMKVELAEDFHYFCPAPLDDDLHHRLKVLTAEVFRVLGCYDVARVDFRLDADNHNEPYILEINPLPGLNPGYSDLCIEANAGGWTYEQLIGRIVDLAAERHSLKVRA
jgi:D-alanine-D-alanine ligase